MNWYNTGYDGVAQEEQRIQAMQGPNRLWIPAGNSRALVMVDDEAFCIKEHNAKLNGSWRNHHTCNQGFEDTCESCTRLGEKSRAYTGYLTMVDCTLNVDKKGNKYQYEVKLVGGKVGTLKKWKRKKEDKGSLIMTKWKVHREDDKKPAVGDEWEFDGPVTDEDKLFELANYKGKKLSDLWDKAEQDENAMALLKKVFQLEFDTEGKLIRRVVPFNYMEVLQPRGNAYVRELLGGVSRDEALGNTDDNSGGGSGGAGGKEEDVPF